MSSKDKIKWKQSRGANETIKSNKVSGGGGVEAGTSNQLTPKACRWEQYALNLLRIAVLVLQIGNLASHPPLPPLVNGILPLCVLPLLPRPPVDLILGGLDPAIL